MKLYNLIKQNNIFIPRDVQGRQQEHVKQMIRNLNQNIVKNDVTIDMNKFPKGTQFNVKQIRGDIRIKNIKTGDLSCFKNLQKVTGNFDCGNNNLTSLKGSPKHVGDDFDCYNNNLTSLEGAPKHVGSSFWCDYQRSGIKFTKQDVRKVSDVKGAIHT